MENTKKTSQHLALIALADIEPRDYQRVTNPTQVDNIVRNFDEAKLGVLVVSEHSGKYGLIDGAHRSRALRVLGYTHAPCIVLSGLTYEQEAEYFRNQNQNKRTLTPADLFKAGLAARDEQSVRINNIVKSNGFYIGKSSKNFYGLSSIYTMQAIASEYGYETLDNTLCLIASTWAGIPRASQSECLFGVAEFIHRYGMADFSERLREKFQVIWYDYVEAMRLRGSVGSGTSRKKYCRILVEHYNRGLRNTSKKRLTWED